MRMHNRRNTLNDTKHPQTCNTNKWLECITLHDIKHNERYKHMEHNIWRYEIRRSNSKLISWSLNKNILMKERPEISQWDDHVINTIQIGLKWSRSSHLGENIGGREIRERGKEVSKEENPFLLCSTDFLQDQMTNKYESNTHNSNKQVISSTFATNTNTNKKWT